MFENLDLSGIHEENARTLVEMLLNQIEELSADLLQARITNQQLRDEINQLKGEQGKPDIKANKPQPDANADHSSEKERRKPRERHKKDKKTKIVINHEEVATVNREVLPADAIFKGHQDVVIQDISLRTDNVLFHKEVYYSPSQHKTYLAILPAGYEGQFGPGLKTLIRTLYFGSQITEPKILEFVEHIGIQISLGQISNMLIKNQDEFHAESDAVFEAGKRSSPYQHIDDTATRVDGQNQNCHVLCNPVYTAFRTRPHKDRLTVLEVLRNGRPRIFLINTEALSYLAGLPLSKATRQTLQSWQDGIVMDDVTLMARLNDNLPDLLFQQRKTLIDATAVAAYHAEIGFPVIQTLICDDAPQFNWLAISMMSCWIHEGRHYKKLLPVVGVHRKALKDFLKRFWEFYDRLLDYREQPTQETAIKLETEFGQLFATQTGYNELDKRIAKTLAKKEALLLVLKHPELSLHNNPAELGARFRVRKRDISFGPRTQDGKNAWDTFMTLAATCKKLGISFYDYIRDRITKAKSIPPLAKLIQKRAKELNLGWSYLSA
ncbi:MAG: transposase [Chloroflexi bacterium]|nr:transposase [Chloroflexota bacterium]